MTEIFLLVALAGAEQAEPAIRAALQAGYMQSGLEQRVNEQTGQLERKYISPEVKAILSPTIAIGKAVVEQRFSITFNF